MSDLGVNDLGAHVRGLLVTKTIPHRFCVPPRWATGYIIAVRIFPAAGFVLIRDSTTGEEVLVGHHYLCPASAPTTHSGASDDTGR